MKAFLPFHPFLVIFHHTVFSKDLAKYPFLPRRYCIGFLSWFDKIELVGFRKVDEWRKIILYFLQPPSLKISCVSYILLYLYFQTILLRDSRRFSVTSWRLRSFASNLRSFESNLRNFVSNFRRFFLTFWWYMRIFFPFQPFFIIFHHTLFFQTSRETPTSSMIFLHRLS